MKRRDYIKNSIAGSAAIGAQFNANIKGAADRVNVAVVGIRGMGKNHIKGYSAFKNVEVTVICDVDEYRFPYVIPDIL